MYVCYILCMCVIYYVCLLPNPSTRPKVLNCWAIMASVPVHWNVHHHRCIFTNKLAKVNMRLSFLGYYVSSWSNSQHKSWDIFMFGTSRLLYSCIEMCTTTETFLQRSLWQVIHTKEDSCSWIIVYHWLFAKYYDDRKDNEPLFYLLPRWK